jgi:hypothetical protein
LNSACRATRSARIHWTSNAATAAVENVAIGRLHLPTEVIMRAEIQSIIDEIKQSVVLLRRHL